MPMPRLAFANHRSFEDIQRSEQRSCSVPFLIVGLPLRQTGPQRQNRLRAVQCLNLAFLIHA